MDNAQALGTGNVTVNGGILAADPQPINVKGNYTQNAGGTLQLNVAGANPGQYDTLNVGGSAALGGTFKLISLGFQPKAGDTLTLVTTGGSVTGRFARFIDPFATGRVRRVAPERRGFQGLLPMANRKDCRRAITQSGLGT